MTTPIWVWLEALEFRKDNDIDSDEENMTTKQLFGYRIHCPLAALNDLLVVEYNLKLAADEELLLLVLCQKERGNKRGNWATYEQSAFDRDH